MVDEKQKIVTKYVCNRCGQEYDSYDDAEGCEERGTRGSVDIRRSYSPRGYIFYRLKDECTADYYGSAPLRCSLVVTDALAKDSHSWLPVVMRDGMPFILRPMCVDEFLKNNTHNCVIHAAIGSEREAENVIKVLTDELNNWKDMDFEEMRLFRIKMHDKAMYQYELSKKE